MNIRPTREEDIEQVISLFRANYGEDYPIPEFYDPQWVKRGIYSDNILWMVIEEEGKIVASGACILNFGDHDDLIGEIGRLVVDPNSGGRGLGRKMLQALVEASDDRVEFAFAEARTVHPKTQRIDERIGLVPLGFLPMFYLFDHRESFVLSGQLFGNGRDLRQPNTAEVIPCVAPLALLSLKNLGLSENVRICEGARSYPTDGRLQLAPLTNASLARLLRIEHGRHDNPEIFSSMHLDQGFARLAAQMATYVVASDGQSSNARSLGAIGYTFDERNKNVRIGELIGRDETVKGSLLRHVVEISEQKHHAAMIECDVSATSPRIQETLFELGFRPVAYVPGMVFHQVGRLDVVRMIKLTVPWDLGPIELTELSQEYFDVVAKNFRG